MNETTVRDTIARAWAGDVIPSLSGLVAIPALSPSFDASWQADVAAARPALDKALTTDVPYGAQVDITDWVTLSGWSAPAPSPWLAAALDELTGPVFSEPYRQLGGHRHDRP